MHVPYAQLYVALRPPADPPPAARGRAPREEPRLWSRLLRRLRVAPEAVPAAPVPVRARPAAAGGHPVPVQPLPVHLPAPRQALAEQLERAPR